MTTLTPTTIAEFKRAMTPGTIVDVVNLARPAANGRREVLEKTNTVDLVMSHPDAPRGSHLPWPKKGTVFMDGPTFVLMDTRPRSPQLGEPWIRITPVSVSVMVVRAVGLRLETDETA